MWFQFPLVILKSKINKILRRKYSQINFLNFPDYIIPFVIFNNSLTKNEILPLFIIKKSLKFDYFCELSCSHRRIIKNTDSLP